MGPGVGLLCRVGAGRQLRCRAQRLVAVFPSIHAVLFCTRVQMICQEGFSAVFAAFVLASPCFGGVLRFSFCERTSDAVPTIWTEHRFLGSSIACEVRAHPCCCLAFLRWECRVSGSQHIAAPIKHSAG